MAIALFSNENDKVYFDNLLAARKLKDKRSERNGYEEEIEKALNACGEILKKHGARCNFIAEIDKIESEIESKGLLSSNEANVNNKSNEQITTLTAELTELLTRIPREVSEDLEFFSKQIIDRRIRREETLDKEKELIESYPEVEKIDFKQVLIALKHIFDNIRSYTGELENPEFTLSEESKEELSSPRLEVIGIKKAPKVLLRNLGLIPEDHSKEKSKPITKTNTGLFGIMDDVFSEVYSQTQKTQPIPIIKEESEKQQDVEEEVIIPLSEEEIKKEVEKEASLKSAEIKSVSLDLIEKEDIIESKEQLNEESNIQAEEQSLEESNIQAEEQSLEEDKSEVSKEFDNANEKVEEKTLETEEAITFEMPEEFALVDLAIALCDDANGWLDIYEVNKSLFDKIILENNNGNNKDIEYNKELFSGLTINVPTVFKKEQENKQSLGKAA